jgi:hypothetical protein
VLWGTIHETYFKVPCTIRIGITKTVNPEVKLSLCLTN